MFFVDTFTVLAKFWLNARPNNNKCFKLVGNRGGEASGLGPGRAAATLLTWLASEAASSAGIPLSSSHERPPAPRATTATTGATPIDLSLASYRILTI